MNYIYKLSGYTTYCKPYDKILDFNWDTALFIAEYSVSDLFLSQIKDKRWL